ncbi:MAG: gliding motility-associated ABC transporter permease subunit GldF, partial [Bacteroidota bacterium]
LYASSLSENQIVSFITAMVICFLCYYGFEGLATLFDNGSSSLFIQSLGMKAHFNSISRGVLDTRDLVYFMTLTLFFLLLTVQQLKNLNS